MISSEQTLKLGVRQTDAVQSLELLAKIALKRGAVTNVSAELVLQAFELLNQLLFKLAFRRCHYELGQRLVR
jgi:hypothetical protein